MKRICALSLFAALLAGSQQAAGLTQNALIDMIDQEIQALETMLKYAHQTKENFKHQTAEYKRAKELAPTDPVMKSMHRANVDVKHIMERQAHQAIKIVEPLIRELSGLDVYAQNNK